MCKKITGGTSFDSFVLPDLARKKQTSSGSHELEHILKKPKKKKQLTKVLKLYALWF